MVSAAAVVSGAAVVSAAGAAVCTAADVSGAAVSAAGAVVSAAYHRDKGQNLLVVTEPGDIYVTIGPESTGGGTPQNDSLQVWKNLTVASNKEWAKMMNAGLKDLADSSRAAYRDRTRGMALAVGEESILGEFLLSRFPLPKE